MANDKSFSEIEKKAILHKKGKVVNALDLYRPTEFQEPFFLAMEKSELVRETLGEHVFEYVLRNKRAEWQDYRRQVSAYELDRYIPVL